MGRKVSVERKVVDEALHNVEVLKEVLNDEPTKDDSLDENFQEDTLNEDVAKIENVEEKPTKETGRIIEENLLREGATIEESCDIKLSLEEMPEELWDKKQRGDVDEENNGENEVKQATLKEEATTNEKSSDGVEVTKDHKIETAELKSDDIQTNQADEGEDNSGSTASTR